MERSIRRRRAQLLVLQTVNTLAELDFAFRFPATTGDEAMSATAKLFRRVTSTPA